jgi:hypothetical protein
MREASWKQEGLPSFEPFSSHSFAFNGLSGTVRDDAKTGYHVLVVYGNQTVSHNDLVQFANSLFASQNWPPPQLENAQEVTSCGDSW